MSAIHLADTDGNDRTDADATWAPVLPTPKHPEYPATHSCTSGSLGGALLAFYGTPNVTFSWYSKVTGTTRTFTGTDAFNDETSTTKTGPPA